jgi:hypothetical protein
VPPEEPGPDRANVRAEEFHIVVPTPTGEIEIPWDVIRVHGDPAFDAFWAEIAAESVASNKARRVRQAAG